MLTVALFFLSFFTKEGIFTNCETNIRYNLRCPNGEKTCFFEYNFPDGVYEFISNDKKDTTILMLAHDETFLLKTTGDFVIIR